MRVIISPAKKMKVDTDTFLCRDLPVFLHKAEELLEWITALSYPEQKKLWACNDQIARKNAERFAGVSQILCKIQICSVKQGELLIRQGGFAAHLVYNIS